MNAPLAGALGAVLGAVAVFVGSPSPSSEPAPRVKPSSVDFPELFAREVGRPASAPLLQPWVANQDSPGANVSSNCGQPVADPGHLRPPGEDQVVLALLSDRDLTARLNAMQRVATVASGKPADWAITEVQSVLGWEQDGEMLGAALSFLEDRLEAAEFDRSTASMLSRADLPAETLIRLRDAWLRFEVRPRAEIDRRIAASASFQNLAPALQTALTERFGEELGPRQQQEPP
jgi:hypothetical protein